MNNNEKSKKKHSKHRKYQLLEHFDTYSQVLDIVDDVTYICFKLDKHEVGDEFYLYEQARERRDFGREKIIFNYSILNDYKENDIYTFDIEEEKDGLLLVSNHCHLTHAVPAYFKKTPSQRVIDLEVENLDLDTNRLQFKRKPEFKLEITYSLDDFEKGVDYEFEIKKYFFNKKRNLVLIVANNNKNYYLNPPPHLSQVSFKSPVIANVVDGENGTEQHLRLSRRYLFESLYIVGQKYDFKIVNQIENCKSGISYWTVAGEHENRIRYFPEADLTFNDEIAKLREGDTIELTVLSISDKGNVKLISDIKNFQDNNYLVEDVFEAIGYANQEDRYFFKYANVLGVNDEEMQDADCSFIEQYNQGNNLWVFSYLSFLDDEVNNDLEAGEFEKAKRLIDIYINIEKWILEGSDYLTNFSQFKIDGIIQKAEQKIVTLKASLAAIDLFLNGKDQEFINKLNVSLTRTPYLNNEKKEVFKQFLNISQYFRDEVEFVELSNTIFLLLERNLILEDDRWIFINSINAIIYRIKGKINELLLEDVEHEKTKELKQLITYSYLLLYFYIMEGGNFQACLTSINLLRNLSLYHNKQDYLDLAIELIIHNGYIKPSIIRHKDILGIDFNELKKICVYDDSKMMTLQNAGNILSFDGSVSIVPKNLLLMGNRRCRLKTLAKLGDLDLYVKSHFNLDIIDQNDEKDVVIERVIKTIKHIYINSDYDLNVLSYRDLDISFDEIYSGRVKSIHHKGKYCYLSFEVDGQILDTLLHMNSFNKNRLAGNMNDFLRVGDLVQFKIDKVYDEKITISPISFIYDYADRVVSEDRVLYGQVMLKPRYSDCKVMTTNGMAVSLVNSNYEVGQVVKLKIADIKENSHWHVAYWHELCDKEITVDSAAVFRDYLIATGMLIPNEKGAIASNSETDWIKRTGYINADDNSRELRVLSSILIHTLEHRLNYIVEPKEIALNYLFIITLSGVMKHPKSFEYSNKLNNLAKIVRLEFAKDMELLKTELDEGYLKEDTYQELDEVNSTMEMLRYMNTDLIELPLNIQPSSPQYKLKKLIEAINLVKTYELGGKVVGVIKNLIVHELYNTLKVSDNSIKELQSILSDEHEVEQIEKPKRVVTNLGAESKYREFKTTIFHSASDVPQRDVIMRTICGFLNAYEGNGSLYIGVDDSGEIKGLKSDLNYYENVNNLDRYQNYLQQMVVDSFPKEINTLLEYRFHKSNNLNYLEIIVPCHDKPVTYKDEFFQRQGVQTRILKGQDITDFIIRKTSKYAAATPTIAFQPDAEVAMPQRDKGEAMGLDTDKLNEYVALEKPEVYSLHDSANEKGVGLTVETLPYTYSVEQDNLLGYFYILKDDRYIRYMLSKTKIKDYEIEVEITEKYKTGYLLFCYDNACVNKVAVRNIITKSFNTIYMNAISNQGKLMKVIQSLPNEEIGIEIKKLNKNFVKLYNIDNISEHKVIGLKGNCIIEGRFSEVVRYYHNEQLTEELDVFRKNSTQGFGEETTKYMEEFELLKEISK